MRLSDKLNLECVQKNIPEEMKKLKQWVVWKYVERNGKLTKIPFQVNGEPAKTTDSRTWEEHEKVMDKYSKDYEHYDGIGFVFSKDNEIMGVDLDHCIEDGKVLSWAQKIIDKLNSYTEISPSNKGVHIIIKAKIPGSRNRKGNYEMYDNGRYFVMTGNHLEGTPKTIEKRQKELEEIYNEIFEFDSPSVLHDYSINLSSHEIVDIALNAKNGDKFRALYEGDITGYTSPSEADQAFCNLLAFYTKDFNQIYEIIRSSGLYREKWNRKDYRERTIGKALATVRETYEGKEKLQLYPELQNTQTVRLKESDSFDQYHFNTLYEYLEEGFWKELEKNMNAPLIKTGIDTLDKALGGGLYSGLYVVGAISSLGKTALTLQIADTVAENNHDVLFFSLEMGRFEMVCRSITRELFKMDYKKNCNITTGHVINGRGEGTAIAKALEKYQNGAGRNISIIEGNFDVDVKYIKEVAKRHIEATKNKPVVFIDYLQVLRPIDMKMSDKQAVDFNVVELKRIARDLDIPVIVVSSFNRMNYNVPVSFEAFKESGSIEYTGDVVLGMQLRGVEGKETNINELKLMEPRPIELVILKNRRGKAFEKISLDYYPKQNYFVEVI